MELRPCEFFLVRYVPDPVKNEFVNIGVLMRAAAEERGGETLVRFTRDWRRVRCVDPDADVAMFEALESELRERLSAGEEGKRPLLEVLLDSWSNNLQISGSMACLADNLAAGMDRSMALFVEPRKREAVSRQSGRQSIYAAMRTQFERAGVWESMRKRIAAASYTRPGDPLRIDCGYRPNGVIRMFHAVSLDGDLEAAKVLAFSVPGIRDGVKRVELAELELTAIVEPLGAWEEKVAGKARAGKTKATAESDRDRVAEYRFAVETMERETIRVMTVGDLPRIAETARRELRI
jgi:hypothetical protein